MAWRSFYDFAVDNLVLARWSGRGGDSEFHIDEILDIFGVGTFDKVEYVGGPRGCDDEDQQPITPSSRNKMCAACSRICQKAAICRERQN